MLQPKNNSLIWLVLLLLRVLDTVVQCLKNLLKILSRSQNFFDEEFDKKDLVWKALIEFCPKDDNMKNMIFVCLTAISEAINRQCKKYFSMKLTEQMEFETESARLHNMDAEEMMGMFSAAQKFVPNATLCYLSSRLCVRKNNVINYLNGLPKHVKDFATKKREINRLKMSELDKEMTHRAGQKRQKKDT